MTATVLVLLLGTVLGSFVATCAFRVPRDISLISRRSRCPSCASTLRWYELIPIVSFTASLGKCRRCHQRISLLYPSVEILGGGLSLLLLHVYGLTPQFIEALVICHVLLLVTLVDWKYLIISNQVLLWGFLLVLTLRVLTDAEDTMTSLGSGLGALCFMSAIRFIMDKLLHKESMGIGDIKLAGLLGFVLGFELFLAVLWLASVIGLLVSLRPALRLDWRTPEKLPFGAFLAVVSIGTMLARSEYRQLLEGWLG